MQENPETAEKFSPEELRKMLKDITQYLKDIYRIWLKDKQSVSVKLEKQRLRIGVIQYRLLTENDFLRRLKKAILYLSNNPHIKIMTDFVYSHNYEIEEVSPEVVQSYIALKNNETSTMLIPKKIITANTYENRFVKGFLIRLLKTIDELASDLREYLEEEEYKIKLEEVYEEKITNMIDNITNKKREIFALLNLDFLKDISPAFEVKPTSVIKYNPAYNRIYKLYLEFNSLLIPFDSDGLDLQSFDDWYLFELWVFFQIFEQCREKFGEDFKKEKWFEEEEGRIKLKIGEFEKEDVKSATIKWSNGYTLYYQRSFGFQSDEKGIGSYTIGVRPDVVLWNEKTDELWIFDAKKQTIESIIYESEKTNNIRRPTIAQLHQYKEAIIEFETKRRVVKGVYAIIPKKPAKPDKFFEDWYRKKYGFGICVFEILNKKEEVLNYAF